eukprot:GHVR01019965.1.p2 GENE.GHVR01019965.1~~GHVR01019965.1.p2  ORF type:complete len:446 (-),score=71.92 GHVR01019965.1:1845-3182(-)
MNKKIELSHEIIKKYEKDFTSKLVNKIALNSVSNNGGIKSAINRDKISDYLMTFSTEIKTPKITDQKMSGRCWIFAALNLFRVEAAKKMKLENFELSQSYLMFYDKLEKSNYFLESIIETTKEKRDSRLVTWLLENLLEDGGQWNMLTNLVNKYGVVPKEIYPESMSSGATNLMNLQIKEKLREYACTIRDEYKNKPKEEMRCLKQEMLSNIYRILAIHNGIPPTKFHWNYRDKDFVYNVDGDITPIEFYKKYVGIDLENYVSLINCPTLDKPFNNHYTVKYLGNIAGGSKVSYINVNTDIIKEAVIKTLKSGEPVWFGCDVGKNISIDNGVLDQEAFSFEELYSTEFKMTKASMVDYRHSKMTHAMLFVGVHEENSKIKRWKVENSWGDKKGRDGFLIMSDKWFEQYVYQVVIPKKSIDVEILRLLKDKAIELEPWDAMGSLAI